MMEVNRSDWQAIDSTVHTPVLATMREEKPGVTIESRRVLPHMELCDVNLFTTDTLLRYKSEWDPRQHAHTKGGYLEGEIRVPKVPPNQTLRMTLETYPAEDVPPVPGMTNPVPVHPCLVHLVRMGPGKRENWKEPVPTKIHWRQIFEIKGDKVSVINTTSDLDVGRNVPAKDLVTEMNNNSIVLGNGKGNLNLVFLKPKQNNCDASITEVLSDRLQETDVKILEQYKKHFTKKEGGINMTKIRVKVSFYDEAGNYFCSAISPQTLVGNGNKKLGCLEIYDCHPRKSNPDGGRKIMMISEYTLSDDVVPRFELYDAEGRQRKDVERKYLAQPIKSSSTMVIKNATAIIFLTPRQLHWDTIQNLIPDYSLKLVAYREGDGMKSRALDFDYTTSCNHQMDGDEDAKIEIQDRAKPGAKKRNMNLNRQTLQVPNVKKARTASGGSYVDAWEPPQIVTTWPSPGGSSGYNTSSPPQPAPNYPDLFLTKAEGDEHYPELLSGGPESCEAGVRMMVGWEKNPDQMLKTEEAFDQMSARSSHSGNSEDYLCQILNIPKSQEAEDIMNIPANTLLDPNSPERLEDIHQEQHDSEEEPEDLMSIQTSTLLDANSPERLEDIYQEQHDSEDDQQTELNTPVIIPDLETLFPRAPPQVVRSQQNVFLPLRGFIQTDAMTKPKTFKDEDFQPSAGPLEDGLRSRQANRARNKTKTVPKTVAASRTDLAQLFTVFTVLFILLLCVVQITTNILGVPLNTFPLVGITSVLSLGIVGAKFARS